MIRGQAVQTRRVFRSEQEFLFIEGTGFLQEGLPFFVMRARYFLYESYRGEKSHRTEEFYAACAV